MTTVLEARHTSPFLSRAPLSSRIRLLGTENAFKIGPHIRRVEDEGPQGHQVQPGRARLSSRGPHPRRGEAPAGPRPHALLRPAGPPGAARGDRARDGREARPLDLARKGRRLPGRQDADRLLPGGLLRPRRRGDLPEPGVPDLRVVHAVRRGAPRAVPPRRGEGLRRFRERPREARHRADEAHLSSTPPRTRRAASSPAGSSRRSPTSSSGGARPGSASTRTRSTRTSSSTGRSTTRSPRFRGWRRGR